MNAAHLLLYLLAAHALCDYALQGDFMSKAKNPVSPTPGVPWLWVMSAHVAIHAGAVLLLTGSLALAMTEYLVHFLIDVLKCRGYFGFGTDQALHVGCKMLYLMILLWVGSVR